MSESRNRQRLRPRGVMLDFYGTLVAADDVPMGRICDRIAAASPTAATAGEIGAYWGRVFTEMCIGSFGRSFRLLRELEADSLGRVLERFAVDLDAATLSEELFSYWVAPPMHSEVASVLSRCDVPVCVVSNVDNADLAAAVEFCGFAFERIVTSEDCRSYKPRAEMFDRGLEALGLRPDEVLQVGDSFGSDVRGAQAMGIPVLWIHRKGRSTPVGQAKPDFMADELQGLLDVLTVGD